MLSIDQYVDLAKRRGGFRSDRQLSLALGRNGNTVTNWRTKRAWPGDEVMVRLAEIAGEDPHKALFDLNVWRNAGRAKTIYLEMRNSLFPALLVALFSIEQVLNKGASSLYRLYIMLNFRAHRLFKGLAPTLAEKCNFSETCLTRSLRAQFAPCRSFAYS